MNECGPVSKAVDGSVALLELDSQLTNFRYISNQEALIVLGHTYC